MGCGENPTTPRIEVRRWVVDLDGGWWIVDRGRKGRDAPATAWCETHQPRLREILRGVLAGARTERL